MKMPRPETCHVFQNGLFATTKITFPRTAECLPYPSGALTLSPNLVEIHPRLLKPVRPHSLRLFSEPSVNKVFRHVFADSVTCVPTLGSQSKVGGTPVAPPKCQSVILERKGGGDRRSLNEK